MPPQPVSSTSPAAPIMQAMTPQKSEPQPASSIIPSEPVIQGMPQSQPASASSEPIMQTVSRTQSVPQPSPSSEGDSSTIPPASPVDFGFLLSIFSTYFRRHKGYC